MMKSEFEKIAGRTVTDAQYKAIEALYMDSTLDKLAFVKSMKAMLKSIPEQHNYKKITVGVKAMPNGTWMTYEAELVDVDIAKGKTIVKRLSPNRCWAETWFDVWAGNVIEA